MGSFVKLLYAKQRSYKLDRTKEWSSQKNRLMYCVDKNSKTISIRVYQSCSESFLNVNEHENDQHHFT